MTKTNQRFPNLTSFSLPFTIFFLPGSISTIFSKQCLDWKRGKKIGKSLVMLYDVLHYGLFLHQYDPHHCKSIQYLSTVIQKCAMRIAITEYWRLLPVKTMLNRSLFSNEGITTPLNTNLTRTAVRIGLLLCYATCLYVPQTSHYLCSLSQPYNFLEVVMPVL